MVVLPMAVYVYYWRRYFGKRKFWHWYAECFVVGVVANAAYSWALTW